MFLAGREERVKISDKFWRKYVNNHSRIYKSGLREINTAESYKHKCFLRGSEKIETKDYCKKCIDFGFVSVH